MLWDLGLEMLLRSSLYVTVQLPKYILGLAGESTRSVDNVSDYARDYSVHMNPVSLVGKSELRACDDKSTYHSIEKIPETAVV